MSGASSTSPELAPGAVAGEELAHARAGPDRDAAGARDFAAELCQAEVVPDVRVGQEDPVDEPAGRGIELLADVGAGVEQPARARARIGESQRGHAPSLIGIGACRLAAWLRASELRQAAVLRRADHDHARTRGLRRGRVGDAPGQEEEGAEQPHN
jgi:hypothetical protein